MKLFTNLTLLIIFIPLIVLSQSKEDLLEEKKKLQKDINYANSLLKEIHNDKKNSVLVIQTLDKKINTREKFITSITFELENIDKVIHSKTTELNVLNNELDTLKADFANMIKQAYKSRNRYNELLFIFSAKNFYQAYKRIKFIQQYVNYRKTQAKKIEKKQFDISSKIVALNISKTQKNILVNQKKEEKMLLASEKKEKDLSIKILSSKENELMSAVKIKQETTKSLQLAIEKIINEEIRKSREKNKNSNTFTLTPEGKKISDNFAENKGNLPWPVKKGIIISNFGLQNHPVLPGIKINNNGIDIATNKESIARASFDGVVSAIIIIPGANKAVIIRHGEYLSVYSNLSEVFVKTGNAIKTKQELGLIYSEQETLLHFEIWKGTEKLNPSLWLYFE